MSWCFHVVYGNYHSTDSDVGIVVVKLEVKYVFFKDAVCFVFTSKFRPSTITVKIEMVICAI